MNMSKVISYGLKYKYDAFGLKIHSELKLPELIPLNSEYSDVKILFRKITLPTQSILHEGINFKSTKDSIYRFWEEIGKFKITKSSIIIDPASNVNLVQLRTFILGTILATLVRLRGSFVLHASAVNINDSAIAFSGFKGFGKSTTAMAFYKEGYPIVADDYVVINAKNGIQLVNPGFPRLKLSNETKESLNLFQNRMNTVDKSYVNVDENFKNQKLELKKIYLLKRGDNLKISSLTPQTAFIELIKNTFGIYMFSKSELPNNFFKCEQLIKDVEVKILEIYSSLENISQIVKIVEEDMGVLL